jgi:gluconolactonase
VNKFARLSLLAAATIALTSFATAFSAAPGGFGGPGGPRGSRGAAPAMPTTHPAESPLLGTPTRLPGNYQFTEGPTSDKDGNIFFVDQNANAIHKYTFDKSSPDPLKGDVSLFLKPSGYSNGMSFDNDGNLITCADGKNELWSIAAPFPALPAGAASFKPDDLKISVLLKTYDPSAKKLNPTADGKLLNGPNDVFVVPAGPCKGGMFLTDPLWARSWWAGFRTNQSQLPGAYVYYLSPDRKTLTPVITDYRTPNGIIGTPDGKTLYVSDMGGNQTHSYTIKDDGTLADKKLFCNAGSDGMTIDSDGNIYTTVGNARAGLQIWSKDGKLLESLPVGCTNCCFGGKNGDVLFITAQSSIWAVQTKTHKVGPQ